jgi:hypothetical protein
LRSLVSCGVCAADRQAKNWKSATPLRWVNEPASSLRCSTTKSKTLTDLLAIAAKKQSLLAIEESPVCTPRSSLGDQRRREFHEDFCE